MCVLVIGLLACVLALLIFLLAALGCYTMIRIAEVRARREVGYAPAQGVGAVGGTTPDSMDEGFENIMTYGVDGKTGDAS